MSINVERIIRNAVVEVLHNNAFFGHIICQLPRIFTQSVPTMAVGRKPDDDGALINLYINPEYIERIYQENPVDKAFYHIVEVLKHELHHIVFKHLFLEKRSDRQAFETACELSVNSYIDRSKLVDRGVFPEDFDLPPRLGFEEYYEKLAKNNQQQSNGSGESEEKDGGNSDEGNSQDEKDDGKKKVAQGSKSKGNSRGSFKGENSSSESGVNTLDDHSTWKELAEDKMAETMMKDIVRKAKEVAISSNQWGNVPNELKQEVDKLLELEESKVPWEKVLRDFVASSSETDLSYTNKRISKRYGTRLGTVKEDRLRLAIGIDTSGSINDKTIDMFFNELHWISKDEADITVFEADAEIQREYPFRLFDGSFQGRGGTDLQPVIKECDERGFDALIYFTDAYAPNIPERYRIPVIFVIDEEYSHLEKEKLPYKPVFAFYVKKNGEVTVE